MGEEQEDRKPASSAAAVFDAEAANGLVGELRGSFRSGRTRSYEWRVGQLKAIWRMCDEHEKDVVDALALDLSKPELESVVYEMLYWSLVMTLLAGPTS
ncbi:hypothetical protein Tsubulata_037920 [Turnera subulata]|uniref:Aldehyde dehydrogenase domain-containing protein n=1 Tax=Turnera subulata TaxID=218843 RepID=A0A9Q0GGB7_9ROSI|nr:hypothetical protein Tsubulata_037920 [Turnera subulata]